MLIEHQHPHNKSIMVSVLGIPNVGKSSLINYLLGMDLSIVSSRPQTTRHRINCILTVDRTEIVLVDTPGLHRSELELNKRINDQAFEGGEGTDLNLLLLDATQDLAHQLIQIKKILPYELRRVWIILTKTDLLKEFKSEDMGKIVTIAKEMLPQCEQGFAISTKTGDGVHDLIGAICDAAEPGPHLYPGGEVSNKNQRFFVSEYVREQAFELLKEELPYELAVSVEDFKEEFVDKEGNKSKNPLIAHISATILVNRPSQRAIVIGSKGSMIKEIGTRARKKIEKMTGYPVHLNLHVKVSPKWFKNNYVLEELGLPRAKTGVRGWKKRENHES